MLAFVSLGIEAIKNVACCIDVHAYIAAWHENDVIISNIKYKWINNLQLLLNCGQFLYGSQQINNIV